MKSGLIISVGVVMIVVLLIFCKTTTNVQPPKKLENIPNQAVWRGGVDGGRWFLIDKVLSDTSVKMKIYNELTGELLIDSIFTLDENCINNRIDSQTLLSQISMYDGEKILLNTTKNDMYCTLRLR